MVKKKKGVKKTHAKLPKEIKELNYLLAHIEDKADDDYYKYSIEVIEDRAIFGEGDGLKPVTRRFLWAAHQIGVNHKSKYVKSALLVGETMGKYHPHGDSSIYTAAITAANCVVPMIDGSGNWGTMTDDAAAMRYTNARLSSYADLVFFDKFYLPIIDMVPNYDDTRMEPLVLPAMLPNSLVNGNFGIAPGVRASSPVVKFDTLAKAVLKSIAEDATPITCKDVELVTDYGGIQHITDTSKNEMKAFLKSGRGRFVFDCQYTENGTHEIRIHGFPFSNLAPTLLERVESVKGVSAVRDDSSKKEKNIAFVIVFQKSLSGLDLRTCKNTVLKMFQSAITFNMQGVERKLVDGKSQKKLNSTSIPGLINSWLYYRIDLEKRACRYWTGKNQEEIAKLELMVLAVRKRDIILKLLGNKKLDDTGLEQALAKALKITVEQAKQILDLKIRQLKALEESKLLNRIKELKSEIVNYKGRIKDPRSYIHKHVSELVKKISAEYLA